LAASTYPPLPLFFFLRNLPHVLKLHTDLPCPNHPNKTRRLKTKKPWLMSTKQYNTMLDAAAKGEEIIKQNDMKIAAEEKVEEERLARAGGDKT
jgi:hypothetical protein